MDLEHLLNNEEKTELGNTALKELGHLIEELDIVSSQVKDLEEQLSIKKKYLNQISQVDIPEFLRTNGMSGVTLADGRKVSYKDDLSAKVVDMQKFYEWLDSRGEADIVKLSLNMTNETYSKIKDILKDLPVEKKETVHPQTLNKYIRELNDVEALDGMVNVYRFSKTQIK